MSDGTLKNIFQAACTLIVIWVTVSGHVPVEQQVRQFVMQNFKFQSALSILLSRLKKFSEILQNCIFSNGLQVSVHTKEMTEKRENMDAI